MSGEFWFCAKAYGWGWYPANWRGWAVSIAYILVVTGWSIYIVWTRDVTLGLHLSLEMAPPVLIPTAIFFAVCWLKGERPRWRWGKNT